MVMVALQEVTHQAKEQSTIQVWGTTLNACIHRHLLITLRQMSGGCCQTALLGQWLTRICEGGYSVQLQLPGIKC